MEWVRLGLKKTLIDKAQILRVLERTSMGHLNYWSGSKEVGEGEQEDS